MSRLNEYATTHPAVSWFLGLFSFVTGAAQWLVNHADEFAKITGLIAALLGVAAGWYAFRINRLRLHRMEAAAKRHFRD